MVQKRDTENAVNSSSYLVILSHTENSSFSLERYPCSDCRGRLFHSVFLDLIDILHLLDRVRKLSHLLTCFCELIFIIRSSNKMAQHFEALYIHREDVLALQQVIASESQVATIICGAWKGKNVERLSSMYQPSSLWHVPGCLFPLIGLARSPGASSFKVLTR